MTQSNVTISPDVIRMIVRNTALASPSVRGLVDHTGSLRTRDNFRGVEVTVAENKVHVKLHLTAAADAPLMDLGQQLQAEVAQSVEEIVGLHVAAVDVYFEDVTA